MAHYSKQQLILNSGRRINLYGGVVGISDHLGLYAGYDDDIDVDNLTKEEKLELADYAIGLWNKYKDEVVKDD